MHLTKDTYQIPRELVADIIEAFAGVLNSLQCDVVDHQDIMGITNRLIDEIEAHECQVQ